MDARVATWGIEGPLRAQKSISAWRCNYGLLASALRWGESFDLSISAVSNEENIVPELGSFFDRITTSDCAERFTARRALGAFRNIYSQLSVEQL